MLKEQVREFFHQYIKVNYDFDTNKDYDPILKIFFFSMAQESLNKQIAELNKENANNIGSDMLFRAVLVLKGAWPALEMTLTTEEFELLKKYQHSDTLLKVIDFLENDLRAKAREELGPLVQLMEMLPEDFFIEEVRKYEQQNGKRHN